MDQPPASRRPALATVSRLTPRNALPGSTGATPDRPSVLAELRRRAPGVWGTVRRHPALQAATAKAADWTSGRRPGVSVRADRRSAGPGPGGQHLADVVPLPLGSERGDRTVGSHDAVVVDLDGYRAARRSRGRGTA